MTNITPREKGAEINSVLRPARKRKQRARAGRHAPAARSKTLVGRILPISQPIAEALARRRARRDPDSPLVFHRDDIPIRRGRTTWRKLSSASIDGRLCLGLRFQLRVMFR